MVYCIIISKKKGNTPNFIIQEFWVEADLHTEDKNLKNKLLGSLFFLDVKTIYNKSDEYHGKTTVSVIPYPMCPKNKEYFLMDVNVGLELYKKYGVAELSYDILEGAMDKLTDALNDVCFAFNQKWVGNKKNVENAVDAINRAKDKVAELILSDNKLVSEHRIKEHVKLISQAKKKANI